MDNEPFPIEDYEELPGTIKNIVWSLYVFQDLQSLCLIRETNEIRHGILVKSTRIVQGLDHWWFTQHWGRVHHLKSGLPLHP